MTGFVISLGCTLSGEHVSLGKFLHFVTICKEGYCLTMSLHTSLGCNSQVSFGTLAINVFSTSWQTLFSTTSGHAGVNVKLCAFWSQDVEGIAFREVIDSVLQS